MNGLHLATIIAQLIQSSNDAKRYEATVTTYAEVVNHVLRRYATAAVTAEDDKEFCNHR